MMPRMTMQNLVKLVDRTFLCQFVKSGKKLCMNFWNLQKFYKQAQTCLFVPSSTDQRKEAASANPVVLASAYFPENNPSACVWKFVKMSFVSSFLSGLSFVLFYEFPFFMCRLVLCWFCAKSPKTRESVAWLLTLEVRTFHITFSMLPTANLIMVLTKAETRRGASQFRTR